MLTYLKTNFRRLLLLIVLLFLFPLCACAKGVDATSREVQPDQKATIPTRWLGYGWKDLERGERWKFVISENESWEGVGINENCQADNGNLPQTHFSDTSICGLHNFNLFFDRFSKDATFQISATKFPLKLTAIIPLQGPNEDTIILIKCLNLPKNSNTSLQLFPIKEQREHEHLRYSYTVEGSVATVDLWKEDAGVSIKFVFTWDRCWVLSEVKDYSM